MAVFVGRSRFQQADDLSRLGQPRHAALSQWGQFVADTPRQDERYFPAARQFERQFSRSVIREDRMGLELAIALQSLEGLDEFGVSGLVGTREIGSLWIALARMRFLTSTSGFEEPGFIIMKTASGRRADNSE